MDQRKMSRGRAAGGGGGGPVNVQANPVANSDDARYSDQGTFSSSASVIQMGLSTLPENWNSYVRFVLDVPPGVTITDATVTFTAANARTNRTLGCDIQADVSALDPAVPGSQAAAVARAKTTASVNWNTGSITYVAGDTLTTSNFASVVQEIIDQASWAQGNHIILYFQENGSGAASDLQAAALEHTTYGPCTLSVTYTP